MPLKLSVFSNIGRNHPLDLKINIDFNVSCIWNNFIVNSQFTKWVIIFLNETWFCLRRSPSPKLSTPALLLTTVSPLTFDCSKAAIRFSGIPHRPNPVKKNASEFIMKCSRYQYVCTLSVNMIGIDWKGIREIMTDYIGIRTQAPWISSQIFTYWAIWLQRLNQSDHDSIMKTFKLKKRCQRVFHYRSVTSIID